MQGEFYVFVMILPNVLRRTTDLPLTAHYDHSGRFSFACFQLPWEVSRPGDQLILPVSTRARFSLTLLILVINTAANCDLLGLLGPFVPWYWYAEFASSIVSSPPAWLVHCSRVMSHLPTNVACLAAIRFNCMRRSPD